MTAGGIIIAAPRSGSGKTLVTLGLIAALRARGPNVAAAKTGPDYIDAAILSRTAGRDAVNLDPWAMSADRLKSLAGAQGENADLLLAEGVMGLFDGAADGRGSTADLAATLGLPVVLVVDAERQSQSIAALVHGFATWRRDVRVGGIIINRVATQRHERMLRQALEATKIPVLGALPRRDTLLLPERHLGLVLPNEVAGFDAVVAAAGQAMADYIDLDALIALARPLPPSAAGPALRPLGQRIAIARDDAFAFIYPHMLADWRSAGA
ncbi:MAG: cobyrinate a,c-diamide synthase, partial [Devosia sp.]